MAPAPPSAPGRSPPDGRYCLSLTDAIRMRVEPAAHGDMASSLRISPVVFSQIRWVARPLSPGTHEEPTGVMSLSPKPADANTVPAEPPSANAPTADWYGNRNGADGGFRPAGASPTVAQSRRNQE